MILFKNYFICTLLLIKRKSKIVDAGKKKILNIVKKFICNMNTRGKLYQRMHLLW